ncbi:hypothetical protein COW36_02120 [bacterium (Candidatus Blackallbacteria) CG17_big_fil_post_rev_8_21_14_2_50_48_46]|uniref:Outer membrane lipoprotein-sorting protein n=1 Tax=bacterium (Candidatus Blackallbacteria) CG17_big_fil_post_rev_8_21_14_2_50_48_46 TaxID=2014261 RepID=A0A2M7GAR1_9BACT|nr:MAG: hypothetical protein COW64_26510 [bacterium (Candidatus Blackallbacteria) CG18_big_fil_WC_8_21_14_2_50_49_26]PIW19230.1 MAG: hypothetical protein COW36_02120 [bacterium (Candidatus Blackallbacteria) CG17_big_fil_post_rev_8_21_14_2_50_48_46]PIW45420.1 MAG: hypothetical protein COW20_20020 [bacterium (Candidatus Blackallbacteria) CG13_big_fil_rev_8_21_14_2_50_49_14]
MYHPIWSRSAGLILSFSLILSACGSGGDDSPFPLSSMQIPKTASSTSDSAAQDKLLSTLPKIMAGIDSIKARLDALEVTPVNDVTLPAKNQAVSAVATSKTTSRTASAPKTLTRSAAPPKTIAKAAPTAAEKGHSELMKVLDTFHNAGAVQATVEKIEKNLSTGETATNKLKLFTKKPNVVKIEVIQSSKGSSGTKLTYTSDSGTKVKVRPGGALGFVTTDLAKTDDRLISVNKYLLDSTDFFGVYRRLSSGYKAELIGATTVAGVKIHVLKVTAEGSNSLDPRIAYEHIGYDPKTYAIRMMEIFDKSGSKEPYFRLVLPTIEYLDSLPDSTFKI